MAELTGSTETVCENVHDVGDGDGVIVTVGAGPGKGVAVTVTVGKGVGVAVTVTVGAGVGVAVTVTVGAGAGKGVIVIVTVGVGVGLDVGLGDGCRQSPLLSIAFAQGVPVMAVVPTIASPLTAVDTARPPTD